MVPLLAQLATGRYRTGEHGLTSSFALTLRASGGVNFVSNPETIKPTNYPKRESYEQTRRHVH